MSSELDDINDFFLAHSVDDNKDLAFGSDGEGSDYKQRCIYFVSHMNVTRSGQILKFAKLIASSILSESLWLKYEN